MHNGRISGRAWPEFSSNIIEKAAATGLLPKPVLSFQ